MVVEASAVVRKQFTFVCFAFIKRLNFCLKAAQAEADMAAALSAAAEVM